MINTENTFLLILTKHDIKKTASVSYSLPQYWSLKLGDESLVWLLYNYDFVYVERVGKKWCMCAINIGCKLKKIYNVISLINSFYGKNCINFTMTIRQKYIIEWTAHIHIFQKSKYRASRHIFIIYMPRTAKSETILKFCIASSITLGLPHILISPLCVVYLLVAFQNYISTRWKIEIISGIKKGTKTKCRCILISPSQKAWF